MLTCCRIFDAQKVSSNGMRQRRLCLEVCHKISDQLVVTSGGSHTISYILLWMQRAVLSCKNWKLSPGRNQVQLEPRLYLPCSRSDTAARGP